jgi:hypothetical protein
MHRRFSWTRSALTIALAAGLYGLCAPRAHAGCVVKEGAGTVDAPAPGTAITCDDTAPNPFVGPVGGMMRRDGWSVVIGSGAVVEGGVQATYPAGGGFFIISPPSFFVPLVLDPVPVWLTGSEPFVPAPIIVMPADVPLLDRRIGVYGGVGTAIFNAGEIRSGDNLVPIAPAPAAPGGTGVGDYLGILDRVPFDAGASRATAETVANRGRSQAEDAVAAGGQARAALGDRLAAAEAHRPAPWIEPRDISGIVLDPRYPGYGGGGGVIITSPGFPPFAAPEPERFGVDVTDDTTLVNAGLIVATNDAVRAGSGNRIVNAGTVESIEDNGFVLGDRNHVANTGAIVAKLDGIAAGNDNTFQNTEIGTIAAGRSGIAANDGATVANAGTIDAGKDGARVGVGSHVLNDNTGIVRAVETALAAGSDAAVDNRGDLFGWRGIGAGYGSAVANSGSIDAAVYGIEVGGDAVVLNSGGITAGSDGIRTDGNVTVVNTGTIDAGSTAMIANGGSVLVNDGHVEADWIGMALFYGGTMLNLGTVTTTSDYGAGLYISGGNAVNEGTVEAAGDGIKAAQGAVVVNSGRVSAGATAVEAVEANVTVLNRGILAGAGGTAVAFSQGENTLVLDTGSELRGAVVGGERRYANDVDTLILAGRGAVENDVAGFERMAMLGDEWTLKGRVEAAEALIASGTLAVDGRLVGTTFVYGGATLAGSGTVDGTVISDGTLAPGGGGGFAGLAINGDVVVNGPGRLLLEIGNVGAGAFDVLTVTDDVFFNGILELVLTDPAALEDGDIATVLSYDGLLIGPDFKVVWSALPDDLDVVLQFDANGLDVRFSDGSGELALLGLSAGAPFNVVRSDLAAFRGIAVVADVAEPSTLALLGFGIIGLVVRRRA